MLDRTLPGIKQLQHVVVLMMENRSFDHMLGALHSDNPAIDGLTGNEFNLDTTGEPVKATPDAEFQSQLDPDPDHHFPAVDLQIFGGVTTAQNPNRQPNMKGFVQSYYNQQQNVGHSHEIMNYFTDDKLPVLSTPAKQYAVFTAGSLPSPALHSAIAPSLTTAPRSARSAWTSSIGTSNTRASTNALQLQAIQLGFTTTTRPAHRSK
jgi:phospholipase C